MCPFLSYGEFGKQDRRKRRRLSLQEGGCGRGKKKKPTPGK